MAVITGADSGIGRAVALAYAREGADVAILDYSHDADETRRAIEDLGRRAIAPAYVFFASNADSSFFTGQVLAELGRVSS